jgi:hypothetical protein
MANTLTGTADGDSGAPQASAPGTTPNSPAGPAGAGGTTPATASGNPNTPSNEIVSSVTLPTIPDYTFQASRTSTQEVSQISTPGRRLKNPLGEFTSYTYQLSLYVITPSAYQAFISGGRKNIDIFRSVAEGATFGGAYLIAQSGGINNTNNKRAPGFEFDYGIDNLVVQSYITGKTNEGTANLSDFDVSFDIIEPYGFSFITNLRRVNDEIAKYTGGAASNPKNPSKQFFILGIRFFGYGADGTPAQSSDIMSYNGSKADGNFVEGAIDPMSQNGSIFEHYKEIQVTSIKIKLDGKMTVYHMEGKNSGNQAAFSMKRGLINETTTVTAGNVAEAIDKLMVKLNKIQTQRKDSGKIGATNNYKVVWAPGTQQIVDATLLSEADLSKFKWPGSGAVTTEQVNAALEIRKQGASNNTVNFQLKEQTPILSAINQIIAQSSYLEDALKIVYTTALQSPETQKSPAQITNTQQKNVSWYSCSATIEKMVWDEVVNDWAYDITYYIQKYQTPVVDSVYVKSGKYYPGPHKRYDYWYTGKNSEIIRYEQTLDNLYINVALDPSQGTAATDGGNNTAGSEQQNTSAGQGNASAGPGAAPKAAGLPTDQQRQGKTGHGMEAQNNYLTSLYDPNSFALATIDILGDPDYLFEEPSFSENIIYSAIYGKDNFNINPTGGQVFIEIDFKEAVDYTSQTGTLSINDSILFWEYPENISKKIKGVSYMLLQVDSKFSGGAFTQKLDCMINAFPDPADPATEGAREANQNPNTTPKGTPAKDATQSASTTGFKPDPPTNVGQGKSPSANESNQTPATPVTRTGVADGDGSRRG